MILLCTVRGLGQSQTASGVSADPEDRPRRPDHPPGGQPVH